MLPESSLHQAWLKQGFHNLRLQGNATHLAHFLNLHLVLASAHLIQGANRKELGCVAVPESCNPCSTCQATFRLFPVRTDAYTAVAVYSKLEALQEHCGQFYSKKLLGMPRKQAVAFATEQR